MQNLLKSLLFVSLGSLCSLSWGHPAKLDPNQPITICSDAASVEQLKQEALYTGNVIMTQGNHELRANTLTMKKNPNGGLQVVTARGNPARFVGKQTQEGSPLVATAQIIHYYPEQQLIVLEGSAILEHQQDKFEGPSLSYHLEKQVISASSQNNNRPTVVLHPRG